MIVIDTLKAAAARAGVSTNVLSNVSGFSRSTFSYWFRSKESERRQPRPYRIEYLKRLATAINRAYKAGDLPAEPKEAEKAIKRWMNAVE